MIRLAGHLAWRSSRDGLARGALTVLGVAAGTCCLLIAASVEPAIRAQQQRTAWQHTDADPSATGGDPLLWWLNEDGVDGRTLQVLRVAATGPTSPAPLGISPPPGAGEVHVSPALGELLERLPPDRLADRFPAAPAGTISRHYLAGPDDLVAVVGHTEQELRAIDARVVHQIRTAPVSFDFTDLLRVVLGIGAVGLLTPVAVFVATSTRIGAARREQRFAALRLAGATPRQVLATAALESGALATLGALLGTASHAVLRPVVARVELDGQRPFPADVAVSPLATAGILLAVVAVAVAAAAISLRRLQVSPLGVARRSGGPPPRGRRLLLLGIGSVVFAASLGAATGRPEGATGVGLVLIVGSFAAMILGIAVAGPWLTVLVARLLACTERRPSLLLAGRRLQVDPVSGFRAVSGLVLAVFVVSVLAGLTPALLDENERSYDGALPATSLVARVPAGTSRAAVDPAIRAVEEVGGEVLVAHLDPARPEGSVALIACGPSAAFPPAGSCPVGTTARVDLRSSDAAIEPADHRAAELATMPVALLAVATDGTAAMTDRARTAIVDALPTADASLGAERSARANQRLRQLSRLADLALIATLVIAGCSLAVSVAAGIVERRRPFTLLRVAGVHLRELRRTALAEAIGPLLLIALASAAAGVATSALVVGIATEAHWAAPGLGFWLSLGAGLTLAIAVVASTLPLLDRVTRPANLRFE